MTVPETRIEPFDPATAPDADLAALHAFTMAVRENLTPGEPHTSFAEAVAAWRSAGVIADVGTWLARDDDGAVVARGMVTSPRDGQNQHLARAGLDVLPEHRRCGLARALLAPMTAWLRASGRTSLVATTYGAAPAGEAFARRLGAVRGLENSVQQLDLRTLDPAQVRDGLAHASRYVLEFRDGAHAEDDLAAIAELQDVMNTAPMGALAVAPERRTPAMLRQVETAMAARGLERWTCVARDGERGRLVGFTELFCRPQAPRVLHQGDTGVFPEHRGHGLGRRLKAAMLERVLRERPEARFVRTTNADSNAAMLSINRELGFTPWLVSTVWQAPLEAVERWLSGTAT